MIGEIRRRSFMIKLNLLISFFLLLFIWLNDLFYPRLQTTEPNWIGPPVASLQKPPELSLTGLPVVLEEPNEVTPEIYFLLNQFRHNRSLPYFRVEKRLQTFATQIAGMISTGKLVDGSSGYSDQLHAWAVIEFDKTEDKIIHDIAKISNSTNTQASQSIANYWINRAAYNGLDAFDYDQVGVGIQYSGDKLIGVLVLAETLFYYQAPFPRTGPINISAQIAPKMTNKNIEISRVDYYRGWLVPVKQKITEIQFTKNNDMVHLHVDAPGKYWSRIIFNVGGVKFNRGRAISKN